MTGFVQIGHILGLLRVFSPMRKIITKNDQNLGAIRRFLLVVCLRFENGIPNIYLRNG